MTDDLYAMLGLTQSASLDDIKAAHRTLSKQFHGDTGGEGADQRRFVEVQRAYRTLGDPQSRADYDINGIERGSTVVDPIQQGALALLGMLVDQLLDQPDALNTNVIERLEDELDAMVGKHEQARLRNANEIAKCNKMLKRLKRRAAKADKPDVMAGIINARINILSMSNDRSLQDQETIDRAMELIEDGYDFEPEPWGQVPTYTFPLR